MTAETEDGNKTIEIGKDDIKFTGVNEETWTYKDGYYYYKEALNSGEDTKELFTGLKFAKEIDNRYAGAKVKLEVEFQATQAANNGASAEEAAGWPE